jgi:hypothetical protein
MFSGGFRPWTKNPRWAQQALEERLAEEAMRRKKQEESSGGGDIVVRIAMVLAGAVFVSIIFGNPRVPIN